MNENVGVNSDSRWGYVLAVGLMLVVGIILGGVLLPEGSSGAPAPIPDGYAAVLTFEHDGQSLSFGPFVGYYFCQTEAGAVETVDFICRNERNFYTKDKPADALLFEGRGVLITLPETEYSIPRTHRINPVFFSDAPDIWIESRPEPKSLFLHFHSCYTQSGAVRTGYWLRHTAKAAFTYDMGGRVGENSPLYHEVTPGENVAFPTIIEFDHGPEFSTK